MSSRIKYLDQLAYPKQEEFLKHWRIVKDLMQL